MSKLKVPSISLKNERTSLPLLIRILEPTISVTSFILNFFDHKDTFKPSFLEASASIWTFDLLISRTQSSTWIALSFIKTRSLSAMAKCKILSAFFTSVLITNRKCFSFFWVLSISILSA